MKNDDLCEWSDLRPEECQHCLTGKKTLSQPRTWRFGYVSASEPVGEPR